MKRILLFIIYMFIIIIISSCTIKLDKISSTKVYIVDNIDNTNAMFTLTFNVSNNTYFDIPITKVNNQNIERVELVNKKSDKSMKTLTYNIYVYKKILTITSIDICINKEEYYNIDIGQYSIISLKDATLNSIESYTYLEKDNDSLYLYITIFNNTNRTLYLDSISLLYNPGITLKTSIIPQSPNFIYSYGINTILLLKVSPNSNSLKNTKYHGIFKLRLRSNMSIYDIYPVYDFII